ncbi:MAG: hypothetical protein ACXVUE_06205 [Solirubrobacteraceae bacterium]
MTIGSVLDEIEAGQELVAERQVVTIITAIHRGWRMTGVLDETFDALGRVERATLLLRPLSTLLDSITAMLCCARTIAASKHARRRDEPEDRQAHRRNRRCKLTEARRQWRGRTGARARHANCTCHPGAIER